MPPNVPSFAELLAGCSRSAVHLEMRDAYGTNDRLEAWRAGQRVNWADQATWWAPFTPPLPTPFRAGWWYGGPGSSRSR
jgi:hypothetical protein